jgi:hypothetical protein
MIRFTIVQLLTLAFTAQLLASDHQELVGGNPTTLFKSTVYALLGPSKCTATKIAPQTYLTAAHCLTSGKKVSKVPKQLHRYLVAGELILLSARPEVRGFSDFRSSTIKSIHIHPSYDYYKYYQFIGIHWLWIWLCLQLMNITKTYQ